MNDNTFTKETVTIKDNTLIVTVFMQSSQTLIESILYEEQLKYNVNWCKQSSELFNIHDANKIQYCYVITHYDKKMLQYLQCKIKSLLQTKDNLETCFSYN